MNMHMKKLWCLMFVFSFVLGLSAQTKMRVWIKGSITDYPVAIIDSITFFEDLEGAFSVDVNKKVVFSKGNLQYHPKNSLEYDIGHLGWWLSRACFFEACQLLNWKYGV